MLVLTLMLMLSVVKLWTSHTRLIFNLKDYTVTWTLLWNISMISC